MFDPAHVHTTSYGHRAVCNPAFNPSPAPPPPPGTLGESSACPHQLLYLCSFVLFQFPAACRLLVQSQRSLNDLMVSGGLVLALDPSREVCQPRHSTVEKSPLRDGIWSERAGGMQQ